MLTFAEIFDCYIRDAIYQLPTFEVVDDNSPPRLRRDPRMSKAMIAQLLTTKLQSANAERLGLTSEIRQTLRFIGCSLKHADNVLQAEYAAALASLAAHVLPLREIVKHLASKADSDLVSSQALQNASAAAVYLGRISDVELLLGLGASGHSHTRFFGNPLSIAAWTGHSQIFSLLLCMTSGDAASFPEWLTLSSRMDALGEAAAAGHIQIARALLDLKDLPTAVFRV